MSVCDPQYRPVADAFKAGFSAQREVGAAVAVWHQGRWVVDLYDGYIDSRRSRSWQADTLVCVFSVSKAITATCVLQAVDAGLIEIDAPVSRYWPEFAQKSKAQTTVRHLMAHQAGLPGFHAPVDKSLLFDWSAVCAALAAEEPWWPAGEQHGYHARTFGFLLGEVLRRVTGKSVGAWLRERIAGPLDLDVHIGLSESDLVRCADMIPARMTPGGNSNLSPAMQSMLADFTNIQTPTGAAFQNPSMGPGYMNQADFRQAQLPALNGHGTARDVAKLFGSLPQLLSPELLQQATATVSFGADAVLKSSTRFGLGYMLHDSASPMGWPGCFGHAGAGGSIAFCDPQRQLGFAFVMNQMQRGVVTGGDTATACIEALNACLA